VPTSSEFPFLVSPTLLTGVLAFLAHRPSPPLDFLILKNRHAAYRLGRKSLGLFRQMIGRGLRPAPDKSDVVILDHSGGVHRHGRPDDHIEWTLETDKRAVNPTHESRKAAAPKNADPFCSCPACGLIRGRGMACDACGWQPKPRGRDVEVINGDLIELGKIGPVTEEQKITFYRELRGFQARARRKDGQPYHPRWAAAQHKDKFKSWPPWSWDSFEPLEPTLATLRWIKHRQIAYAKRRGAA